MPLDTKKVISALATMREKTPERKFGQSVELIVGLRDIDLKDAKNRINETIEVPNAVKGGARVGVFASGDLAVRAKRAGIEMVLGREDIESLAGNKNEAKKKLNDYDFFVAEAQLMPLIGRHLGQVLGPKGKMPAPIPPAADIGETVNRYKRMVQVRVREQPNAQCRVGDAEMSDENVAENIQVVYSAIERKLEKGVRNIRRVYVKETMGPTVEVEIQ